jgi:hypothetical protein
MWKPKVHYRIHKTRHWTLLYLSKLNPFPSIILQYFKINFNIIILQIMPKSRWYFPFGVPNLFIDFSPATYPAHIIIMDLTP